MSWTALRRLILVLAVSLAACEGTDTYDFDSDGATDDIDCAPSDPEIHPEADDPLGDGIDQDCDGADGDAANLDGDGVRNADDCDPLDPNIYPGADDPLGDDIDSNCDGVDGLAGEGQDADGDGATDDADCEPKNPDVYPGATEIPDDGIDQDCNGADSVTCFVDADGDGYGSDVGSIAADGECSAADNESALDGDCDDADPGTYPGATEICDTEDNDCDEVIDDGFDLDGDGFFDADDAGCAESYPDVDCDDDAPAVFPGAAELCNGIDDDCGDGVDEGFDGDGDGYATCVGDCDDFDAELNLDDLDGDGFSSCTGDCDDEDPTSAPDQAELCVSGIDENCDGDLDCDDVSCDTDPLCNYTSVVVSHFTACAIRSDDQVVCWGSNTGGAASPPGGAFDSVAGGTNYSFCGIRPGGDMECWGSPPAVPAGVYTDAGTGSGHSCGVLAADDSVDCWGNNYYGESTDPVGAFVDVEAAGLWSCGLHTNDTISCWGQDLGDPPGIAFQSFSMNDWGGCGITASDTITCWGLDTEGQLTPPSGTFSQVDVGLDHSCGVRPDGTLECWGNNGYNQLNVPAGSYAEVACGKFFTCARLVGDTLDCWGTSSGGVLDHPE